MSKGYVYILTNPCFNAYFKSKIVKIGQAKDVEKRRSTLNTSVPVQFDIFATLYTSKYKIVEKKIHQRLKGVSAIKELQGERRVKAENGEFYLITPAQALKVLQDESELIDNSDKVWDLRGHDRKHVGKDERPRRTANSEGNVSSLKGGAKAKRANFTFVASGIQVGEELRFTEAPITVTVADEKNKVTYRGQPYSLSGFVKAFHPHPSKSGAYQGPKFFTYKGKLLVDMRKGGSVKQKLTSPSEWKNSTQLAKAIVEKYNGGKSKENVWCILNRKRPAAVGSKWRSILEGVGLIFDKDNRVVDWRTAKMGGAAV